MTNVNEDTKPPYLGTLLDHYRVNRTPLKKLKDEYHVGRKVEHTVCYATQGDIVAVEDTLKMRCNICARGWDETRWSYAHRVPPPSERWDALKQQDLFNDTV